MKMRIDEGGRDQLVAGINLNVGGAFNRARYRRDLLAFDGNVEGPAPVRQASIPDQNIEHPAPLDF
ncbi:hypothetical protein AIOL_004779 [Candidatus Rhodobacter oscarellae]|uniref:Uncharacterized protein n=1 Tax=Candidatus Rhodobacter oscarellae TaxID=1675527 RepID=A0A0J9EAH2_9RHOB|nr:hypothetical protein AIOL_004779 [Candidatus Rhodobacter lobularis]